MRLKSPATYILFLVIVCFAAGVISVMLGPEQLFDGALCNQAPFSSPTTIAVDPTQIISTQDERITILILGVDHIADPSGKLFAVWFITFDPTSKSIDALGLPLNLPIREHGLSIGQAFDLWDPPEFGASFIAQLGDFAPSPIFGFVALDEQGFARLVDFMGGVELDGQHMSGATVIGSLRLTYANPAASLQLQARILEGLRSQVSLLGTTPELTQLTALSPIHAYTSPSPPELSTLAIPLLPLEAEKIHIELFQSTTED